MYTNINFCSKNYTTHIPISCVPREEITTSEVTAICASSTVAYITDMGRSLVYRVDTVTGSCGSFGSGILGNNSTSQIMIYFATCLNS